MQTACFTPTAVLTPLRPKDAESTQPLRSHRQTRRARTTPPPPPVSAQKIVRRRRARARGQPSPSPALASEPFSDAAQFEDVTDLDDTAGTLARAFPGTVKPANGRKQSTFDADASINSPAAYATPNFSETQRPSLSSRISEALFEAPQDDTLNTSRNVDERKPVSSRTSQIQDVDPAKRAAEEERRIMRRAARQETFAYNVQLKELARKRNLDACLELLADMRSRKVRADAYTYSTILTCCSKLRATDTALELYARMLADRVRVDEHVLVTMMGIAARADPPRLDMLRALFHQSAAPNIVMCNVFMDGLANLGMVKDVEGVLRYMALRGLNADSYTATAVAKAYVRAGRLEDAEKRVAELEKQIPRNNAGPRNVIMAAYSTAGDLKSAQHIFDHLGSLRTLVSYNVLIAAHIHTGNMRAAFDVFDSMLHEGHTGDRYTMHSLMKVCIAAGDAAVAYQTYTAFRDTARWIPNNVSYRLAAQAAAMTRDPVAVSEIAEDARKYGAVLREDTVVMLVVAALRCGCDDEALAYAGEYLARTSKHDALFEAIKNNLDQFPGPVLEDNTDLDSAKAVDNLIRACEMVHGLDL